MRIEGVSWELDNGFQPYVSLTLDGVHAEIPYEQNPPKAGVVILEPIAVWGKNPPIVIPADPGLGRGELVVESAVDDPAVVQLWWDMYRAVDGNEFEVGPRPVTKAVTFIDKSSVASDLEPDRQGITQRLRDVLYLSFSQIGDSLRPEDLQPIMDAYKAQPNDERHPIDVWIGLLQDQRNWFAMRDITTELGRLLAELYAASVPLVLRRFMAQAFNSGASGNLTVPEVSVLPDVDMLIAHANEVLDSIDEGTLYFIAKYLSEHPNQTAEQLLAGIVNSLFKRSISAPTLCDSRVININNLENAWVTERCALDLLATLGMTRKVWRMMGEPHGPHCLANERRGPVPLDATYGTDYGKESPMPPASAVCGCQLLPASDELPLLVSKLLVEEKSGVIPDEAVIWIDVPDSVAAAFGLEDVGIAVLDAPGRTLEELNNALNSAAYMIKPFGMIMSGDVGRIQGEDVAWGWVTPQIIHARDTLNQLIGYPTGGAYKPFIDLGPAGKTGAESQLTFGDPWVVFGFRLCVRVEGRDDCRYYPFLQPVDETVKSTYTGDRARAILNIGQGKATD